uniref:nucleotidyltransferase family protein n=1 Tax=Roseivirga sp. TaxID=1964215 RepID=UPI004048AA77
MISLVKNNIQNLAQLCKEHHVEVMSLFGSATSQQFNTESDLDFLVKFSDSIGLLDYSDNYFSLLDKLNTLFSRKVDLVSEKSLKNPILIDEIKNSKITLYES